MHADEIRFLYAYDRWASRRVLSVLDGLEPAVWMRTDVVGDGAWAPSSSTTWVASQRWRHGFQDTGESPSPNSTCCRRSISCAKGGNSSGRLSMPGCRP